MHIDPTLRTVWLFGPGADSVAHQNMQDSGAQVLIQDLEDFTPPNLRSKARALAEKLFQKMERRKFSSLCSNKFH